MYQKIKHRTAIFFVILFMAIISAPTVIVSLDNTIDISSFYGIGEEEEESESFKLLIEKSLNETEVSFTSVKTTSGICYRFKTYPKPHLNLISPPPEFIS